MPGDYRQVFTARRNSRMWCHAEDRTPYSVCTIALQCRWSTRNDSINLQLSRMFWLTNLFLFLFDDHATNAANIPVMSKKPVYSDQMVFPPWTFGNRWFNPEEEAAESP